MKKVLRRFVDIWKLDFLALFFAGEKNNNKTTILFWIFSSILLTIITTISFFLLLFSTSDKIVETLEEYLPDGAQINITDGKLQTQNIDKPFLREIKTTAKRNGFDGKFVVVVDTDRTAYDDTVLDGYDGGIIVFSEYAIIKNAVQTQKFLFKNISNLEISKSVLIESVSNKKIFANTVGQVSVILSIVLFFWLIIGRLIFALWWALMLLILMRVVEIKESYVTAYKATLNFYFIPTTVSIILWFFGIQVPLLTTMIFTALFAANLIWLKRQTKKQKLSENEKKIVNEEIVEKSSKEITKK